MPPTAAVVRIGITPSVVQMRAPAGESREHDLTVSNEGDESFTVTTSVTVMRDAPDTASALPWINVEPAEFELDPGATQRITVDVDVPPALPAGGYYAVVSVTTDGHTLVDNGQPVAGQLGVPFLITVDGASAAITEAVVERFAAVLEPDGQTIIRAEIRNTGNTYAVLRGYVDINETDGTRIERVELRDATLVLPGNAATVTFRSPIVLAADREYDLVARLDYGARVRLEVDTGFTASAPDLEIVDLELCDLTDQGLSLQFAIQNDSDLGVLPILTLTTASVDGVPVGDPISGALPVAWPNETTAVTLGAPEQLGEGSYVITATIGRGLFPPVSEEVRFEIGGDGPVGIAPCSQGTTTSGTG